MDLEFHKNKLEQAGVGFSPGLTEAEVQIAEESYRLRFPPDLKAFLMFALPTGKDWPNWKEIESPVLWLMLNSPYEGICFDIELNGFWPQKWGVKPSSLVDAFALAKQKLDEAPRLIPIWGHRYLPDRPAIEGNPVLSVHQTDIIYYGSDLWNYFQNEFDYHFDTPNNRSDAPIRRVEFWSAIVDGDY